MDPHEDLAGRVERLEAAMHDLRHGTGPPPDDASAERLLRSVAPALQVLSRGAGTPLLFFASGSPSRGFASGPEHLERVLDDEGVPAVVALARVLADEGRVRLLRLLLAESGCSLGRLAAATGEPEALVRERADALRAAGLLLEPAHDGFELTTIGAQVVALVSWGAWRLGG